ncbi:MAG: thioredoxin domain-containing protein [Bdellovibrionales bacterium]|nr:thioredoxin domain-containing protein [Bdellovibrionales bacterium]
MNKLTLTLAVIGSAFLVSCTSDKAMKDQISKVLKENPQILTEAIEKNPAEFITALQNAAKNAQETIGKQREQDEKKQLEESFNNPLVAEIRADEAILGPKDAVITLVEYSDFECPFCSRGSETVNTLLKKYEGKIRFVYKHLPLSFHEKAMISAQYFEAIRMQDNNKAFAFHDEVFKNQGKLKEGVAFLDSAAKKAGANMAKLKKDLNSDAVKNRIAADVAEAGKFGMQGTPGFLLNGVPVRGAYPADYFVSLITELEKRGKIKI